MDGVTTLQALARRVAAGDTLGDRDAALIIESHDLISIGMMADDVRRRIHGTHTTFVRVFEMHVDAVPAALPSGVSAGEFRVVGRPGSAETARDAVAAARSLAGGTPVFAYALHDLEALRPESPDLYRHLKDAGLDGVAETAVDLQTDATAIAEARSAGLLVLRGTVSGVAGDPLALLHRARDLCSSAGGFRALAPLPRTLSVAAPTTGYDDVKLVALARLLLPDIPSIQVDWPLYGPKLAQVGLTVGADDVDGVAAADAAVLGARRSAIEEIKRNIIAAGFQPVERNGRFEPVGSVADNAGGHAG